MNRLELEVVTVTKDGGAHVKLNDNGENLGILYLDKKQLSTIIGVLTVGSFNKEIDFSVVNPFYDEGAEELTDYMY
jgi:predicted enzyme involved in methoxymalonyl-ACP biosynthesis